MRSPAAVAAAAPEGQFSLFTGMVAAGKVVRDSQVCKTGIAGFRSLDFVKLPGVFFTTTTTRLISLFYLWKKMT